MARMKYFNTESGEWEYADSLSASYPIEIGQNQILPDRYYEFGEVDELSIVLVEVEDGNAHEYCFEFIPSKNFTEMAITPQPKWVNGPQFPAGKTCQVSILRGIGVMICA